MLSTLNIGREVGKRGVLGESAEVVVNTGGNVEAGKLRIMVGAGRAVVVVELDTHEAALLAGEIERAAWAAERARAH